MATEKTQQTTGDDEFVTVSDGQITPETKIIFDEIGDSFTGNYLGMRNVPTQTGSYQQARFEMDGEVYFTNAGYSLREGLKNVRNGTKTRLTYTSDLDTGQEMPMHIFKVETAKKK